MTRGRQVVGAVAFALVASFAAAQPAPRNDIVYSRAVVTPHVPWAATLPGGPIRGFFIPTVGRGREMVELMQRLALEPTTVTIDPQWDVNCWGLGDFYGHPERGDRDDFRIVYGYAEEELTSAKPFEVMVIPGAERLVAAHPPDPRRHPAAGGRRRGARARPSLRRRRGRPPVRGRRGGARPRIWDLSPLVGVAGRPRERARLPGA